MTTTVVYTVNDGYIESASETDWAAVLAGNSGEITAYNVTDARIGNPTGASYYYCYEAFLSFDTSAVGSDSVSAAVLNLTSQSDQSATDFEIRARLRDWGSSLTTADWVAHSSLSSLTLLAHHATSSGWSAGSSYDFTDDNFAANINGSGTTRVILHSDFTEAGTNPGTTQRYVSFRTLNYTGTTSDPKLTITHAANATTGTAASTFKYSVATTGRRYFGGRNWIDNPSFETDTSGWGYPVRGGTASGATITRVADATSGVGSYVGEIYSGSGGFSGYGYTIQGPFRKGVAYSVSFLEKTVSGGTSFIYGLAFDSNDGAEVGSTLYGTWTRHYIEWVPTADRASAGFFIVAVDSGSTFRIDDVKVVASNWVDNPSFEQDTVGWGKPVRGTTNAVTFSRVANVATAALTNSGFESGDLTGWGGLGDRYVEPHYNAGSGWSGTYFAVLHKVSTDTYCLIEQSYFEATPGERIELSAQVSGAGSGLTLQLVPCDSGNAELSYPQAEFSITNDNNNPLRFSTGAITMPANTAKFKVRVFNTVDATYMPVDDIVVKYLDRPDGTYAGDVTTTGAAYDGIGYVINGPFVSGTTYLFSVSMRSMTGDNYLCYGIAGADDTSDYAEGAPYVGGTWGRYTYSWTPSANHAEAGFYALAVDATTTRFQIDDVVVNQLATGSAASTFKFAPAATGTEVISGTSAATFKFSHAATATEYADHVSVANVAAHDLGTGNFSIELWYKRGANDAAGYLYWEPGGAYIESMWDGSIYFGSPGVGDAGVYAAPDDSGVWHHVVVTKGATSTSWKFYFDSADVTPEIFASTPSSGTGQIKRFASSDGATGWQGSLDEVAIYKSVLSPARVAAHYNAGVPVTEVTGTAATTFRFVPAATGTETLSGSSASTFKFAAAATGAETITGAAAATWKFSAAATGAETITGAGASTWKFSPAATGSVVIAGTSAATFKYSTAATGAEALSGAAATTWRFSVAGTGAETITGAAASGPWKFSTEATGTSLEGTTGLGASTFGYSTEATGFVSTAGEAASTFKFSHAATGAEAITGASATTFKFSEAATGTNTAPVMTGTSATTFRFTPAASGWHSISGDGAITWKFSHAATGSQTAQEIDGTSATAFPFATEATGEEAITGTSDTTFRLATEATGATYIPPIGAADTTFKFSPAATGEEIITGTAATTWRSRPYVTGSSAELVYGTAASEWKFAPYTVGYEDITYTGTAASGAWKFGVAATGIMLPSGTADSTFKFSGSAAGYAPITGEAATSFGYSTSIIGLTAAAGSVIGESHLTDFGWSTEIVKVTGAEGLVTQRAADTTWVSMT